MAENLVDSLGVRFGVVGGARFDDCGLYHVSCVADVTMSLRCGGHLVASCVMAVIIAYPRGAGG